VEVVAVEVLVEALEEVVEEDQPSQLQHNQPSLPMETGNWKAKNLPSFPEKE
jgi:hypothetical protein